MTQTRKLFLLLLCLAIGQMLIAQNCTFPVITNVTATTPNCPGDQVTITVDGSLNDATQWVLYTGDCGDTQIATSTDGTFSVQAGATTTYYVTGDGGCIGAPKLIWEEQFDGGIPNTWTLNSSPAAASWQWSDDGEADQAIVNGVPVNAVWYSNTFEGIESPTSANGAAMFNSDVFTQAAGISGPLNSSMTSPTIDCSGLSNVSLKFNQTLRYCCTAGAPTILEVSNDNGATWTNFGINTDVGVNASVPVDDVIDLDISSIAANQANVKVRFRWGDNDEAYYWLIDDVQVFQRGACESVVVEEVEDCAGPGAALASNSNNQLVSVPDDASLDIECELSIEFWCKPSTTYNFWEAIVLKASPNSWSSGYGIATVGGFLEFYPRGFQTRHQTNYFLPQEEWTHVAATYDGSTSSVYVNGNLISSLSISGPIPANNHKLGIGGDPGFTPFNFIGALDEVRVWNKALTQSEIQANMNCEIQTTSDCLVANYHFNQGVAGQDNTNETTLTDASGKGNDGTLIGYQLTGTTSNWIEPGGVTSGQACNSSIVCEPIVSAPPTCPGNVVVSNDEGLCGAYVTFTVESGDVASPPSGSYFPVGTTTVVITGSSGCGEAQTCSFTVTVNDTEAPTIKFCPLPNVNLNNTNDRCGAIIAFGPTPEDNCPGASIEQTEGLASGSLFPIGSTTVVFVATDAANLTTECRFTVNVKDNQAPIAVCKDVTVEFNGEASIDLTPSEVWNQAASSDNCGNVYYAGASPSLSISCDDLGNTVPLTVTIHDGNGNMDNCTADVTVTGLPCGWSEGADDGSLNCPGDTDVDYDVDDESFSMSSDGCWQGSHDPDKAAYVYQELCGDGTLTARLASINTAGYAGLMLRETLDPESRRAGAVKDFSTRRVRREYRSSYGGSVARIHSNRSRVKWFRIVRKGNEIKSYTSTNGSYWRLLYRVVMPNLDDCVYIGMMAYSKNSSSEVQAVFDNVSFSGSGSSLIDNNNSLPNSFTAFDTDLEIEQPAVSIFPNPSNGQSQIELNGFQETPAQIMVRDAFGKIVRQIEVDYPEGTVLPLDLQDMPAGLYLISVMQEQQQVITKKLMIQK